MELRASRRILDAALPVWMVAPPDWQDVLPHESIRRFHALLVHAIEQRGWEDPLDAAFDLLESSAPRAEERLLTEALATWAETAGGPAVPVPPEFPGALREGARQMGVEDHEDEGGACPTGVECDPDGDLVCVDGACRRPPFENGISCTGEAQCQSQVCHGGTCVAGVAVGAACATDGSTPSCVLGAFCQTPSGSALGVCAELSRTGEACTHDRQCWGDCITRFGMRICDATPASPLGEVWCDGP